MRCNLWPKLAVLAFDADGTLWDFHGVMKHALGCALAELRRQCAVPEWMDVNVLVDIRNRTAESMQGAGFEAIRLEAFRRTLNAIGCDDDGLAGHLHTVYMRHRFEDIRLYPEVRSALGVLKSHFVLGLMTNGNSYPDRCGLPGVFHFEVYSEICGVEKPSRRIFDIMVEQSGFSREEIVYVGDSLEIDVAGARAAGLGSVWVNRGRTKADTETLPDLEVPSLTELVHRIMNFAG